jgi:hypothetical protein
MIEPQKLSVELLAPMANSSSGAVTHLLQGAVRREPFVDHGGVSGSTFEKAELVDGTRLVIKHLSADRDWIMRATEDRGRAVQLCAPGMLDRVADAIDDAVLAVESNPDGWTIAMRDVSDAMIQPDRLLGRTDRLRVFRAVARLHEAFWGETFDGLVSLTDRYAMFQPRAMETARSPFVSTVQHGWDVFADLGPVDIVQAARTIMEQPKLLAQQLDDCEKTLIHGDLKHANIGLTAERVVLIDWSLAGIAPPEVEFAYYIMKNSLFCEDSLDDLLADVPQVLGGHFNPRALDLALIGAFVQWVWSLALSASGERPISPHQTRPEAEAQFHWWLVRVSRAFETWSPV